VAASAEEVLLFEILRLQPTRYTTNYCDFKEVAIAFSVRNALRLVATAELADVGARREPPTSGPLHGGVKT
jgi:hypothetical protein